MKKEARKNPTPRMRPEYDFSNGARGKYATRFSEGTNLVRLDSDLAERFPDSAAVNRALRSLAEIADRRAPSTPR